VSITAGLAPQQITGALDRSDFTSRHAILYASVVLGLVLPGISKEFNLSPASAGYLASSVFIGMLVGSTIVGTLARQSSAGSASDGLAARARAATDCCHPQQSSRRHLYYERSTNRSSCAV
jgi:hypothetical protein